MKHAAHPVRRRKQAKPAQAGFAPEPPSAPPLAPARNMPEMPLPADPLLAAASLLPLLDGEAQAGHAPSRDAALLLRRLLAPAPAPAPAGMQSLADAVHRLAALVRQQDRQMAQLRAMLDALL